MPPNAKAAPLSTGPLDQIPGKGSVASSVGQRSAPTGVEGRAEAPDILACARWLQTAHGLYVFAVDHPGLMRCAGAHPPGRPCDGKRGKHPCGKWSRDATNDPDVTSAALSRRPRNLGIACGPSRLLVVDEDRPGAFGRYAAEVHQAVPATFMVSTGKGVHYYFRSPDEGPALGNSPGVLAGRGIDIRGAGGYVVAPGSVHGSGVLYAPVDSAVPILAAPAWLVAALRPPAVSPPTAPGVGVADLPRYVEKALQGETARAVEAVPGQRNHALNKAAYNLGRLVGAGVLPEELAARELYRAASVHFGPTSEDMSPGEARATIRSGLLAGSRRPREITMRNR